MQPYVQLRKRNASFLQYDVRTAALFIDFHSPCSEKRHLQLPRHDDLRNWLLDDGGEDREVPEHGKRPPIQ